MYSHDGLRDSLTHLAAPPFFYEELRRGLSRVARGDGQLSLIRLVLSVETEVRLANAMNCPSDVEILQFAEILTRSSREEDLCARLGECEFVLLLYGPDASAEKFVQRTLDRWHECVTTGGSDRIEVSVSHLSFCISGRSNRSVLDLLQMLDRQPLKISTSHESDVRDHAHDLHEEREIDPRLSLDTLSNQQLHLSNQDVEGEVLR